jgi:heat shock protein HtpX
MLVAVVSKGSPMTVLNNSIKTAVLLGLLMGICLAIGSVWGTQGLIFGFAFGSIGVLISYFFSDKIALASVNAQPVTRESAPELFAITERLAQRAGIPMPRLYYAPIPAPNAFATGRNPNNSAVVVTEGLLQMLNAQELQGVLAHELSHIKHRDILTSTIAAIMAGAISQVAWMLMWTGGRGSSRDNPLGAVGAILLMILAPLAAGLIQMAISRSREYSADASGAQLAGGPEGLISALQKLESANRQIPTDINPSERHMFIVMPLVPGASALGDLFRTHPRTEDRIAQLLRDMQRSHNTYASTI